MPLHHVGLSVADLASQKAWYGRAFGLESEFDFEFPGVRGSMMRSPEGYHVELFEREGSVDGLKHALPNDALLTRGYGHFALEVTDLEAVYARLLEVGAGPVWDPRQSPEPGVRMAFVHDPEGHLIELIERVE
jgi:catechol 2,3-dioxygenase-like lactoylglutathione lyase family enzyme